MEIPDDLMEAWGRALADDLIRRGYSLNRLRYDKSNFGNAALVLGRDETLVRLVRDRGQWSIDVAAAGGNDWFSPVIWRGFVESSSPPVDLVPVGDQARWLSDHLDDVEAVNAEISEEQVSKLLSLRDRRAEARRKLPPTSTPPL